MLQDIVHNILHLNHTLASIVNQMGAWTYVILILIIFAETGLVVTPFLPGDSLLLAAGAIAASSHLNIGVLMLTLTAAGILGNTSNYAIGRWLGPKVFHYPKSKIFNPKYLQQAHEFYVKYGAIAIVISRFLPIVRTFAPFVAGIAKMNFRKFCLFNIIGCSIWAIPFLAIGYFFGNLPIVQEHFSLVILLIISISMLPATIAFLKVRATANRTRQEKNRTS
jgi:membrane-associated protein